MSGRRFVEHLRQASLEYGQHLVELLAGDIESRTEGEPVRVEPAQEAALQSLSPDSDPEARIGREPLLGPYILDEFDALQEPFAADVADHTELRRELLEAGPEPLALPACVRTQILFEDFAQHRDPRGTGDRVPLEGVA